METKRKIRRKWKMVVAIVLVFAVMIGIGLKGEERRVEGEPDVISSIIMNNEQYLTVVANRNEIENEEEFAKIVFTGQKIELLVDVKELQKSPYFENKGKAYIKDKDVINFYEVCREHYNLTNSFYEWFWSNIQFNISAEHK